MDNPISLRADYKRIQKIRRDNRSPERLTAHYELERTLANRLRNSSREERKHLYTEVYSELFAGLPDHPQNTWTADPKNRRITQKVNMLRRFLSPNSIFLEVGCGDAALASALANNASEVIALDVTDVLIDFASAPKNFRFLGTSGVDIALPDNSVDVAYSNQLMEHLHVDDAEDQLREIVRVLKPGGVYLCNTPSRVTGPHDISCCFTDVATGFHMREYDYASLREIFLNAGFSKVRFPILLKGHWLATPPYPFLRVLEICLMKIPSRYRITVNQIARPLMGITAIGIKGKT